MSSHFPSIFLVLISALPGWAQKVETSPRAGRSGISLREALVRTLESSPELSSYSWDIRIAESRVLQAGLKPNPELSFSVENATGSGQFTKGREAEQTIQFSQLIERGGKRPARVAAAAGERVVSEWEYEVKRVEAMKDTSIAFVEVLGAQRALSLAKEDLALLQKSVSLAEERVRAAKASTVESIRAGVAVRSATIEVEQAEHALNVARYRLAATWGGRLLDFGEAIGDLESLPQQPDIEVLKSKLASTPQLARWQAVREAREAALSAERAEKVPDITFFAGPRVVGRFDEVTGVVGISIPLPFSNRNQGNIAAAQSQLSKTNDEQRAAEARAFAELNAANQELIRALHESEILKSKLLPEAEQAVIQLNTSYEMGRSTQLEVQDAKRTLITARQQHLRALTEYHKSLTEIEALTALPVHVPQPVAPVPVPAKTKSSKASK